ncbi:MAG: glucose-6-phosphate isomerase, partial [Sphingobium sp. 32-64-5]
MRADPQREPDTMTDTSWNAIRAVTEPDLKTIFEDDPGRLDRMILDVASLRFDWSKTHLNEPLMQAFAALAREMDFAGRRDALFAGAPVNTSEDRAAEHGAERGEGAPDSVARAKMLHNRLR